MAEDERVINIESDGDHIIIRAPKETDWTIRYSAGGMITSDGRTPLMVAGKILPKGFGLYMDNTGLFIAEGDE